VLSHGHVQAKRCIPEDLDPYQGGREVANMPKAQVVQETELKDGTTRKIRAG